MEKERERGHSFLWEEKSREDWEATAKRKVQEKGNNSVWGEKTEVTWVWAETTIEYLIHKQIIKWCLHSHLSIHERLNSPRKKRKFNQLKAILFILFIIPQPIHRHTYLCMYVYRRKCVIAEFISSKRHLLFEIMATQINLESGWTK